MKTSPIKLKSSSKAKLRATKSPSNHNQDSQLECSNHSRMMSSVHTIPVKQSPNKHRVLKSNFTVQNVEHAKNQSYNNIVLRSGSPSHNRPPSNDLTASGNMVGSKSFCHLSNSMNQVTPLKRMLVSPQKQNCMQGSVVQNNESLIHIMSPSKSVLENERSFVRVVELGKKTVNLGQSNAPIKTQRFVTGPAQVVQVMHPVQVSGRQIELERKVKMLEMRIGELYTQKSLAESQLNQVIIRLQYENTFLKQKLNTYPSKQQIPMTPVTQLKQPECQSCQQSKGLTKIDSQKLIKDLEKSQENEYHQSKEIHTLRQQLYQTEEMLSKEISKSLALLEELGLKERENEDMKDQLRSVKDTLRKLEKQHEQKQESRVSTTNQTTQMLETLNLKLTELQSQKQSLQTRIHELESSLQTSYQSNQELMRQIESIKQSTSQNMITKDLLNDLEQNNQLLISAIRSLEGSLKQSQKQIDQLNEQKTHLQARVTQLENQLSDQITQGDQTISKYEHQIQALNHRIDQLEHQFGQNLTQLQTLQKQLQQKQAQLGNKQVEIQQKSSTIKSQQVKIQQLMQKSLQVEAQSSTANSFYKKKSNDPCSKCDELRKTIFKLNSHLNKTTMFPGQEMKKTY